MERHQGGYKWSEGVDGCIFKPYVLCDTDPDMDYEERKKKGKISKIVKKDKLSLEEKIEDILKQKFLHVVEGKGVVVSESHCTPKFVKGQNNVTGSNTRIRPNGPCNNLDITKPENYINFIMEKYDKTLYDFSYCDPGELITEQSICLETLQKALNAAVALIPDEGPWILHTDLHQANVLLKQSKDKNGWSIDESAISDWGNTVVLYNPNDKDEVFRNFRAMKYLFYSFGLSDKKQNTLFYEREEELLQFPSVIRDAYERIYTEAKKPDGELDKDDLNIVRVTSIYGLLNHLDNFHTKNKTNRSNQKQVPDGCLNELLHCSSQQKVIDTLNKYFITKEPFIDLNRFFPPKTTNSKKLINIYEDYTPKEKKENIRPPAPTPAPTPTPKKWFSFFQRKNNTTNRTKKICKQTPWLCRGSTANFKGGKTKKRLRSR